MSDYCCVALDSTVSGCNIYTCVMVFSTVRTLSLSWLVLVEDAADNECKWVIRLLYLFR